jgi:hypothetical protein
MSEEDKRKSVAQKCQGDGGKNSRGKTPVKRI